MKPILLLLNDSFTFLCAEPNNEQLMKYTYLKRLMIMPQADRSEIKNVLIIPLYVKHLMKSSFKTFLLSNFMKIILYY
jgi:hypothetical protein